MPFVAEKIPIPDTDLWSTLFERDDRQFPDDQVLYTNPLTACAYTFAQLRSTTIAFGIGLRKHLNFRKGDVLLIYAGNCIDTPIVTWGAQWIGGVVSPANPAYTVEELRFQSGVKVIVTLPHLLPKVKEAIRGLENSQTIAQNSITILLQGDEAIPPGEQSFRSIFVPSSDSQHGWRETITPRKDLAYLVYSSGTTGLPKGVMLSHRNVVADLLMVASREGTMMSWEKDRILSQRRVTDTGLQCILQVPCYTGVPTIVMESFNLPSFLSIIQDHKITYTYVAPPIVLHLAKSPMVDEYDLKSLRSIVCGAAPLSKELVFGVRDRLGVEVKQAYGLSETSPVTHIQASYSILTSLKFDVALGSVGPPLPNQTIKFMDSSSPPEEVPPGTEGEIWISGPNVFLGYHNNPAATTASLAPDDDADADPFFKTGDIGYADENGNMYVTDRVKELIKYKGYQVAPAELEGILLTREDVVDVAVVGKWDKGRETEVPVAFVVGKGGPDRYGEKEGREIERWLEGRVADHKRLRGGVKWVEEIPKSASGKILRRVLREGLKKEEKEGLKSKL
ncbi:phenylacetyl- ligase protein [Rutstroemia sp. NJR-2017a BBW]|nr:phenylacetyl- ligase protein [Rutstroemia sp. NJR-2017a BBW]